MCWKMKMMMRRDGGKRKQGASRGMAYIRFSIAHLPFPFLFSHLLFISPMSAESQVGHDVEHSKR